MTFLALPSLKDVVSAPFSPKKKLSVRARVDVYRYKYVYTFIHSFSSLSHDKSKASSKASCPHSEI
jgi:hypothetical protein